MSSTSNVQDLLVNVFRPTYKYEAGTGFVPSLTISNVSELIATRVQTATLNVSDSNGNTYIGCNAGNGASNTASNVAIGYQTMAGALNSSNNVALGFFSLDGLSNSDSNVAIGARTDINGRGLKNIVIGPNVTMGDGSYNILIGSDISAGNGNYRFQLGSLLYGDLSSNRVGILTSAPAVSVDISGLTVFRNKVGIQTPNPQYSLDVNGAINVTDRLYVGPGTAISPIYSFRDLSSGVYQAADASYGTGAVGVSVNSMARVVVTSNKTYIYGDLDVCGTLSAVSGGGGGGGGSGTIASNGTASAPSFTFSNDLSTGLHLAGGSVLAFDTSGRQRMTLSNGFLGIGTATPRVALDVSGDISANVYNGPGGTQSAPHYTFSDDRTTGIFFPGANMVGLTAGGTERMRISNANIGIGTTAPTNALDVSGTLRVIGPNGNITFSNGTIDVSGTQVFSSTGALSNASTTSNQIGGVTLTNLDICMSATGILRAPILRNALTPTTYDISQGNIINTGTTQSWKFLADDGGGVSTPAYSFTSDTQAGLATNSGILFLTAGGSSRVEISSANTAVTNPLIAYTTGPQVTASNTVAGNETSISFARASGSIRVGNNVGSVGDGVFAISNTNVVLSANSAAVAVPVLRNALTPSTYDISGGNIAYSGAISNSTTNTSNLIGGVTLSNSRIGIGTSTPAYPLDICASAGSPTINVTTWPRVPITNALMVKGIPSSAKVGNTLNFNTTVNSINSVLATWVASNATSGSSLLINKAGIWSIMLVGSTGDGTQLWMDISTNNHSNITQYTNGNPVLAIAFTPGTGSSNNTTCSFIGYIPSNVYVKPRVNGALGADGDIVWRFNALFHAETDTQTTWPF